MKTAIVLFFYYTLSGLAIAALGPHSEHVEVARALIVAPIVVLFLLTAGVWFWFLGVHGGLSRQWSPGWFRRIYDRPPSSVLYFSTMFSRPWRWAYSPEPTSGSDPVRNYVRWQRQMYQFLFAWLVALAGSCLLGLLFDLVPAQ